ncbi:hypothetical protein ACLOJK_018913 [Asimina triloba]
MDMVGSTAGDGDAAGQMGLAAAHDSDYGPPSWSDAAAFDGRICSSDAMEMKEDDRCGLLVVPMTTAITGLSTTTIADGEDEDLVAAVTVAAGWRWWRCVAVEMDLHSSPHRRYVRRLQSADWSLAHGGFDGSDGEEDGGARFDTMAAV